MDNKVLLKEIRVHLTTFELINLIFLTIYWYNKLDHVFHTNIIAYCQQNRYVRLAIYTDLFTLRKKIESYERFSTKKATRDLVEVKVINWKFYGQVRLFKNLLHLIFFICYAILAVMLLRKFWNSVSLNYSTNMTDKKHSFKIFLFLLWH